MERVKDKTLLLFSLVGTLGMLLLPLVEVKPNRIASGQLFSAWSFLGMGAGGLLLIWGGLLALSFHEKEKGRDKGTLVLGFLLILLLFAAMGIQGPTHSPVGTASRISLSSGFYLQLLMVYIVVATAITRIQGGNWWKAGVLLLLGGLFLLGMGTGFFDGFSLVKEYDTRRTQFYGHLRIHALLTLGAVLTGVLVAVPLGYLAYRKKRWENKVMVPLSIIETIPGLSLFGILLVPLSGLGQLPFFRALGVSGIGWAPAYVALSLYTLLPIGRNALVGFGSVDRGVVESARGMGMSLWQTLVRVEFPLAFPVIFTGVRIAFVQTIGGAVLAGLVGGGGLGSFVFLGLAEASPDLILLGVIPIVVLTLMLDGFMKSAGVQVRRWLHD